MGFEYQKNYLYQLQDSSNVPPHIAAKPNGQLGAAATVAGFTAASQQPTASCFVCKFP
jgi:hypothetical protein